MSWEKAAHVSSVLQFVLFAVSVVFIWKQLKNQSAQVEKQGDQLRQQTDHARVANTQALVSLSSPFNLQLAMEEDAAQLWATDAEAWSKLAPPRKEQYENMIIWWLVFYENIFYQEKNGLLDEAISSSWKQDIRSFVMKRAVEKYWPNLREKYHQLFVDHMDTLIEEKRKLPMSGQPPPSSR